MSSRIVQQTLEGLAVSAMPRVRTTDGHLLDWDRDTIAKQLLKETKLSEQFYKEPGITEEEAQDIAKEVERRVRWMNVQYLSGPLVREIMNVILLERHHAEWRNICTRVGTPVYDAHLIDIGTGFEAKENANLQENAETSHKKKADKISKEQYLLLLPPYLADRHLAGDLHIHDLEYFGTRPFCIDGSTAVPVIDKGLTTVIRPDELPFLGDYLYPEDLFAISPCGPKKVKKVSRRLADRDMLWIKTSSGKSLKVTAEHRIPVNGQGIKRAAEIKEGDVLGSAFELGLNLRGQPIESLNLIREFLDRVPAKHLDNVFVRGARPLFDSIIDNEKCSSFSEISRSLGVEHHKEWYTKGIMPIALFGRLSELYGLDEKSLADLRVGVTGSEHDLPAAFPITVEVAKLLGYFISEGNYNVQESISYNLAITGSNHVEGVMSCLAGDLNSYATVSESGPSTRMIYGVEGAWERSKQVYFGGKLIFLLFRYVFGIAGKSSNKRLPRIVFHLNDEHLFGFLSALFTGDGSAFYRPEKSDCIVNYTTASEMLRQELCLLLASLGMNPHVVELYGGEERRTLYRIQLHGWKNIQTFRRWAQFYDMRQEHIDRFLANVKDGQRSPRPEEVREVTTVRPSGDYVYDLFLEGDDEESHTYFASDGLLIHNCQDWDLRYFLYYGLMPDGLGTKASVAGPAKKAEVAILHAVKALGSAQTNFAGGQGFYNFLTFIAPYFESKDYSEILQLMQMFVYEMTQMMVARGGQLVFSSVQLTPGVPKLWRDKPAVYAGRVWNGSSADAPLKTYGQFEREVRLAFKALMEVMLAGDYWGKPFNFPKPEISIEPDFMKEDEAFNAANPDLPTYQELYLLTFKLAAEYGTPYFDNQLPAYRGAGEGISCYQCLADDELVPFVDEGEKMQIKPIGELFEVACRNGMDTDLNGVEFAGIKAKTPSIDFDTHKASLKPFSGVMRQIYRGKMLKITLTTGRQIRVTPDHPVFALESGSFVRKQAKGLEVGEFLPVLKNADIGLAFDSYLDVKKALTDAGYASEIQSTEAEINIKNAKKHGLPKQIPITQELIKFLGYYLAEGCSDHCDRRYTVRLSFGKHEADLIEESLRCLRCLGFEPAVSVEKTACNVVVNSKLLYLLIDSLGCGHNAHDKSVPDLLFNIEPSLVGQYICCAFKGDGNIDIQVNEAKGYVHTTHNIRMRLVSRDAVQRLIFLAQRIGIQMNYMVRDETVMHPHTGAPYDLTSYTCYITSQDQIQRFQSETGYGESAISQSDIDVAGAFTRIPIIQSGIEYSNLRYPSQYRSNGYKCINQQLILDNRATLAVLRMIDGDIHPLKIKKIEEVDYDGYVYDLVDVSETHNFCNALGVVTGNCCAYQFAATFDSDNQFEDKLYFKNGKHFSMGSWQVVSLNCPRAAYLARGDDELLFEYLRELMDTSVEIFKVKREWMNQIIKNHRMPFATQQPKDPVTGEKGSVAVGLEGLVYTIGVVGVNEMVQFHTGKQMHESRDAWKLAVRAMTEMEIYAKKLSVQHGMTIALARTPAETTAQRFAVSDLIHEEFRDCAEGVVKGDIAAVKKKLHKTRDLPVYYTNGTHLPPGADVTIFERAKHEHVFFPIVDGGNIFHIFMGEATPDPQGLMDFGLRLARETQIGYFTFTKDMTVCLGCSQVSGGLSDRCPSCGSEDVDHISRITGYLQAVSGWNSAKRQELKDRKRYNELA